MANLNVIKVVFSEKNKFDLFDNYIFYDGTN